MKFQVKPMWMKLIRVREMAGSVLAGWPEDLSSSPKSQPGGRRKLTSSQFVGYGSCSVYGLLDKSKGEMIRQGGRAEENRLRS